MWVAQRSQNKPTEPGKLDQLVAGGQPVGIGLQDNVLKECWEEAGIPPEIARQAKPVGAISYCRETSQGLRPDVIFAFDLELPVDFKPVNKDGEVAAFFLWSMEQVISTVRDSTAFKVNCALVVIHFLIRHGFVDPEHPDYLTVLQGLLLGYDLLNQ
jgi:8-oxo-dGTP pyrophosphatase MutT (NUDIX family)